MTHLMATRFMTVILGSILVVIQRLLVVHAVFTGLAHRRQAKGLNWLLIFNIRWTAGYTFWLKRGTFNIVKAFIKVLSRSQEAQTVFRCNHLIKIHPSSHLCPSSISQHVLHTILWPPFILAVCPTYTWLDLMMYWKCIKGKLNLLEVRLRHWPWY